MSWDALSAEVSEMFDEYAWRADEYQMTLESYAARLIAARAEYEASPARRAQVARARVRWQTSSPERHKVSQRKQWNKWRAKQRAERRSRLQAAKRTEQLKAAGSMGGRARGRSALRAAKAELKRRIETKRAA